MKILVIGGTGFIGSHLCKFLIDQGNIVLCLDNNFTGTLENVKDLMKNERFIFIEHDIIYPIILEEKHLDIDQIYHLACPASPKAYQFDPIKTLKTNFIGTLNVLGKSTIKSVSEFESDDLNLRSI